MPGQGKPDTRAPARVTNEASEEPFQVGHDWDIPAGFLGHLSRARRASTVEMGGWWANGGQIRRALFPAGGSSISLYSPDAKDLIT